MVLMESNLQDIHLRCFQLPLYSTLISFCSICYLGMHHHQVATFLKTSCQTVGCIICAGLSPSLFQSHSSKRSSSPSFCFIHKPLLQVWIVDNYACFSLQFVSHSWYESYFQSNVEL